MTLGVWGRPYPTEVDDDDGNEYLEPEPLTGMKSLCLRTTKTQNPTDEIVVSAKVRRRARHLMELDVISVVDQTLNSIWTDVSANRRTNPRLDDAILSAEVFLPCSSR
jgi:hypothetical protein